MRIRFNGDDRRGNGNGNGHGGQPSRGLTLLYKRLRSRARWPRTWTWDALGKRQRQAVVAATGVVVLLLVILLWPARGFVAYGVVSAQELALHAEHDLEVTDCYVRVGDRVRAGDPLYVTVNGDPASRLAGLDERIGLLRLRQLALEGSEPAAAPELAAEADALADSAAALATVRDELAALPDQPDLTAFDLQLATASAAVDDAMRAHRRSQLQLGEIERLRALDAAPIGDLRSAEDREGERYGALQDALLRKRSLEEERGRAIATHALRRSALRDRLQREEEQVAAVEQRLARQRDRLVADLGDEIARLESERTRVRTAHAPRTHLAPADCVVREVSVADGTGVIAGAPIVRLDLAERLEVRAYVPGKHRGALRELRRAAIFPQDDGRIAGTVATRARVAVPVPAAVRDRMDDETASALLVVVEPAAGADLIPGEVVRLRLW